MMAVLRWIVVTVIGPILDGLAGILRDRQARADAVGRGRADQVAVDQQAALDAQKRMQAAQAGPAGREVTQKALDDGKF